MISGVHHISLKCGTKEEFARVRSFYIDLLGFQVVREWPEGVMIDTGNIMLEIFFKIVLFISLNVKLSSQIIHS